MRNTVFSSIDKSDVKYLHLFDEEKIVPQTINLFKEMTEYSQKYIVLTDNFQRTVNRYRENEDVIIIEATEKNRSYINCFIKEADVVVFQALSYYKAKLIYKNSFKNKVFIWVLWGYELYNNVDYHSRYKRSTLLSRISFNALRNWFVFEIVYKRAIKKIDIFLFMFEKDYLMLNEIVKAKGVWMSNCYQTVDEINAYNIVCNQLGDSILVGNSSTKSNNHLKILKMLYDNNIKERSIVCPLNYGDFIYKNEVLQHGKALFGEKFQPVTSFLSFEDYIKELAKCTHAILGNERQQGFGTIIILLYLGLKVFLMENNPIYCWLVDNGFYVFTIDQKMYQEITIPFEKYKAERNRILLQELLSKEMFLKKQEAIFSKAAEISALKGKGRV